MPPPGGNKRKRGDRTYSEDDMNRPSPYRPANLDLARHNQSQSPTFARNGYDGRGRGNRRSSRGGRSAPDSSRQPPPSTVDRQMPSAKVAPSVPQDPSPAPPTTGPVADSTTPVNTQPEPEPSLRPYKHAYLDDGLREDWSGEGRKKIQIDLDTASRSNDDIALMSIVEELVHSAAVREIPSHDAGIIVRQVLESEGQTDFQRSQIQISVLDAISIAFEDNPTLQREPLVEFLLAAGIDEDVLRQEFDQDLLQKLGMIRSTFGRMGIRKQTNVLYRQANFNLMREESEGFAKLMTELFTTSGNEPPTGEVVEETVEHVKAMIGAFDLDVGRSLDVVLDVFGAVLVKQFRFFVKFLRASPWWPRIHDETVNVPAESGLPLWAQPGVYDWKLSEEEKSNIAEASRLRDIEFWPQARAKGLQAFQQVGRVSASLDDLGGVKADEMDDITKQWIEETGTLPVVANKDAAQLLGFKLRFYSSSAARDPSDLLPDHLIYLSALLIKIGFISLNDLYPHIWRSDDEMEELKQLKLKEKVERERAARPGAGVRNALLTAGALADDTVPAPVRLRDPPTRAGTPAKEIEPEKSTPKDIIAEPLDQKILLLKSLLAIGALPEALFILGRFPWILDLYPELPEYIHRILQHSLSKVYADFQPLQTRGTLQAEKPVYDTDVPGITKGHVRLVEAPQKRTLRWAQLDRNDSSDGTDYRFYWDEWNDNVPVCQNVEDVFTLCQTILPLVGVKIGQDPLLVLKLARIGKHSVTSDASEENRSRWLDFIKKVLLPCLSLTKPNAGLVNEVFDFISVFPTSVRYVMYLEWSSGRVSRNPDLKAAFDQAKAETKDVLKRISKTNVKPMARSLAKIAYANPHIVITTALAQIEVYDSIAEVFVEGSRYFTDLGYDVLNWALISSMARAGRSRTQEGGIFTSRWLSALSQFAGKIYKRYSMMKPGPVLQYVSEQLDNGNSTDLKMLEQIVVAMAGIATDTSFNDAQLQAMGGGPLLQSQTILQLLDRRNDSKTSSRRLVKALHDHNLTAKFLLSMAQQRQACVFSDGDIPLKAIGNTFDEISRIMYQYLDLLRSNLTFEDFQKTVPNIAQLLIDYEIPPEIAFWIARPVLGKQMTDSENEDFKSEHHDELQKTGPDIDMKDEVSSEEDGEAVEADDIATTTATPTDLEMNVTLENDAGPMPSLPEKWDPVLRTVMDQIQDHLPHDVPETIGVGFYVTFWQLSLYDISVPSKSYEDEMNRQRKKIAAVTSDRSNVSVSGAKIREAAVRQHQQLIDELLAENKEHLKAYSESRARLQSEKNYWFANKQRQSAEINVALMEYCFLPRMMCSPQDAFFCFKFVKFLHSTGTPNFRTLGFYDSFLKPDRLASLIFICTSKESDNLGRFICELLRDLARWHKDRNVYEREAFGSKKNLPGFAMKVENGKPQLLLDFENFRRILYKWHSNMYSALTKCLSSKEYMHVRNAISVLRSISPVYPAVNFHGTALQKAIDKIGKSDREDLKVASQALLGALHRREKEWVIPQAFRQGQGADKAEEQKAEVSKSEIREDETADKNVLNSEETEAGEVEMTDAPTKPDLETKPDEAKPRPSPKPLSAEPTKDRSRTTISQEASVPARSSADPGSTHRPSRLSEASRSHDLPRKVSPTRSQPSMSLPNRPDLELRNGHRESPRAAARQLPIDPPRSESRTSQSRYSQHERSQEPPYDHTHRHPRPHDRPSMSERDERTSRRDHDSRYGYDERPRSERDNRAEREPRSSYPRPNEREARNLDRDVVRTPYESADRKRLERPDLVDDRRTTPSSTSRNAPSGPPAAVAINPERAALINSTEQRTGMSIRGQAQEKSKGSRTSSPRRDEDRRPPRDERPERSERMERPERSDRSERPDRSERLERSERPDRRQDLPPRPAHPLSTNPHTRNGSSAHDSRSYPQPQIDMQHGRLEPESPNRLPPRNERTLPESDVPSGPRSRPSNTSRRSTASANTPAIITPTAPAPPPPDRLPPTGPAKHNRNNSNFEPAPAAPTPDVSGVHPDRMNLVASPDAARPPPRLPPVNTQTNPPSGPRNGPTGPPSGPSPSSRGPPTGPQMDGSGRGRRHPLAAVNNTLAQASGPGGRGRGGPRQGNQYPPAQSPVQGSRPDFSQSDPSNPNGVPIQPRPQSNRRENSRDMRVDDDNRTGRARHEGKDLRPEDQRRNDRRDEGHRDRSHRPGPQEEGPPRKHHREEGNQYSGGSSRGGLRSASDSKRPKRGG